MMFIRKILSAPIAITFDDIIILPGFSEVEPFEVDIRTRLTKNIEINVPIVSAPMDTVTNNRVAIRLAEMGSMGVIHRHCSIEEQVEMIKSVKSSEAYSDKMHLSVDHSIEELVGLLKEAPSNTLPIVDSNLVLGVARIVKLPKKAPNNDDYVWRSIGDILDYMRHQRTASVLISANKENIVIENYMDRPLRASLDEKGKLLVGAAISPFDRRRIEELDRYADVLVVDVAHFHTKSCMDAMKSIVSSIGSDLVIGNIGTFEAAEDVVTQIEKVDGLRVGIGSGSICKTSKVTGVFAPTLFATAEVADVLIRYGLKIPIIADGGVRSAADAVKAMALGASLVMCGRYFAGCYECPGPIIVKGDKKYKPYRGMGSISVQLERVLDRYSRLTKLAPEGVEGLVPYQGSIVGAVHRFVCELRISMGYAGAKNISELRSTRIAFLMPSGRREMGPHDIDEIEASKYLEVVRERY